MQIKNHFKNGNIYEGKNTKLVFKKGIINILKTVMSFMQQIIPSNF